MLDMEEKKARKKRAPMSEETRKKLSASGKGVSRKRSPEGEARRLAALLASPKFQNKGSSPGYQSDECKAKHSAAARRNWDAGIYADRAAKTAATRAAWSDEKRAEVAKKISDARKREWAEKGPHRNKPAVRRRASNHERALIPYLEALGYQHNDSMEEEHRIIGRRVPDFIDRAGRRVFEYFGDFWHLDDEDQEVIDYYLSKGWTCTLRERDLYEWLIEHRHLVTDDEHATAWSAAQVNFNKIKRAE